MQLLSLRARAFLIAKGFPVHYRMFSNIPELYPLDISKTPASPVLAIKVFSGE